MSVLSESKYILPAEEEILVLLEMEPTDEGLRIGLRGPKFKSYWSKIADPKDPIGSSAKWGGVKFFKIADERAMPTIPDADFRKIGEGLLVENGQVNLAFTRLVDIDKGVEVKLKGVFPYSTRESFKRAFADRIERFYAEYIRDVRTSVMISTRSIGI